MIDLQYGILFSLKVSVEGKPLSSRGFGMRPSRASQLLLNRYNSIFKLEEDKFDRTVDSIGRVLVSNVVADFNGNSIQEIKEEFTISLLIELHQSSLVTLMDLPDKVHDLPQFAELPKNVKSAYYAKVEGQGTPIVLETTDIVPIASSVLSFPKAALQKLIYERNSRRIKATTEDDLTVQFDLKNQPEGMYKVELTTANSNKRIYVNSDLYQNLPFAIIEIKVPAGNFILRECDIRFKAK